MQRCPACGSKLYFEGLSGSNGLEDKCFNCDFCKAHIVVTVEPKQTIIGAFLDMIDMIRYHGRVR